MGIRTLLFGEDTNVKTKNRWIEEQLRSIPKGASIIDIGAGMLYWKKYCGHLKYTSQDFCQYNPQDNNIGLQNGVWEYPHIDIICDICSIPVGDNSYDALLCTEVLEHVPNPNLAMKEMLRIVKPGGGAYFNIPFCQFNPYGPISLLLRI